MDSGVLSAIIGGVSGILGALIVQLFAVKKNNADAAGTIAEASANLIKPLKEEIEQLRSENKNIRGEISGLQKELADWQDWATRLEEQIRSLGHEPIKRVAKKK